MSNQKLKKIINYHLSKVLEYNAFERFEGVTDKSSFLNMIGNDATSQKPLRGKMKATTASLASQPIACGC